MTAGFQQAVIKVDKEHEFEELRSIILRAFAPETVESFLRKLKRQGLRARDWDSLMSKRILDRFAESLAGKTAQELYESLTVSDKAQIREFYLFRVEEVDPKLRTRFHRICQYY